MARNWFKIIETVWESFCTADTLPTHTIYPAPPPPPAHTLPLNQAHQQAHVPKSTRSTPAHSNRNDAQKVHFSSVRISSSCQ